MVGEAGRIAAQAAVQHLAGGGVVVEEVEVARVLVVLRHTAATLGRVDDFAAVFADEALGGNVLRRTQAEAALAVLQERRSGDAP